MPISVACPSCAFRVRLPDNAAGRQLRCPKCQSVIPGPPAVTSSVPLVRTTDQVDAQLESTENESIEAPSPISSAVRKATETAFNPFDDGSDENKPRGDRRRRTRDNYNPFADAPSAETANESEPGQLFDFGAEDPSSAAPAGEFDFGSANPSDDRSPRRRRR